MADTLNELITCPYNEAHRILRGRIEFHLQKCRQQYDKEFGDSNPKEYCPLNSNHRINAVELNYHIGVCPDRADLVNPLINNEVKILGYIPADHFTKVKVDDESECWDEVYPTDDTFYENKTDIIRAAALSKVDKPILSNLPNCPRSERILHQKKRCQMFQQAENQSLVSRPASVLGYHPEKVVKHATAPTSEMAENVQEVRSSKPARCEKTQTNENVASSSKDNEFTQVTRKGQKKKV